MPRARPTESDLSLSRINRLLRSLRSKCAVLTTAANATGDQYTRSRITNYAHATGKGGEWAVEDLPPLAVFDDPKKLAGRALDRRSMMNLRSCKVVHDVVDAWRNILQAAIPSPITSTAKGHIQSLTGICAAIVGRSMVNDVVETPKSEDKGSEDSESESEEEESEEDDAEMAATQELYEAIPTRFRSSTLISHSIALLLSSCPHNPTLLSCLLDLSLTHKLVQESRSILFAFLSLCVSPASSNMAPPLAHPTHTEFLKELCLRWTGTSTTLPSAIPQILPYDANANPHFSTSTFVDIFVSALVDTQCYEAWTCKATARFARQLRQTDSYSYAILCNGLVDTLVHTAPNPDDDRPERLALWLDSLPDQCFEAGQDAHTATMRLLCHAEAASIQHINTTRLATDSPLRTLQSALACAAVKCLGTQFTTSTDHLQEHIIALLRSTPTTATLDNLVRPSFDLTMSTITTTPSGSHAVAETLDNIRHRLEFYADALQKHTLARLEISLWSCALRHSQRMKLPEGSNNHASSAFRQSLIDARVAAEGRREAEEIERERIRPERPSPPASRSQSPVPGATQVPKKRQRALGSVTSVPVHRPMRFQSASTTVSPVTTPRKPRAATRAHASRSSAATSPPRQEKRSHRPESASARTFLLASLKTISLKLLDHAPSDDCDHEDNSLIPPTPRAKRTTRLRVHQPVDQSDSGSDWGRDRGLRGTKRRRSIATPRARPRHPPDSSEVEEPTSPLAKRKRGAATPRARTSRVTLRTLISSDCESEASGSDWGREHAADLMQRAPSRGRRRESEDASDSGSDWERDRRMRSREASRAERLAPIQRKGRVRAASKRRASVNVAPISSSEPEDSSHSSLSPVQFKSLLAQASRRRISLQDEAVTSPRRVRRRRIILDSEDESGLDEPMRTSGDDSDIEIVVDVPVKATTRLSGEDALDLLMYDE